MWPYLVGRIKCCTPSISVRTSVPCHCMPSIYSKSESRIGLNFKFGGDVTLGTSRWDIKFEVKWSKVKEYDYVKHSRWSRWHNW